jgi:hypothetical protein
MSGRIDRQMPEGAEVFLDHVGYFAAELDAAGERLRRLGFQVSDVNVQYNADADGRLTPTGTSNRLAKLRRGFIEVLAATSETPLADQLRRALKRYPGFHVIALTHADMAAERARLVDAGFPMQAVIDMRRRVDTPEGARQMVYSILRTEPGLMPEGRVQMLTNHTPELLWTPGVTEHANRADALTDLMICVDDPAEAAARFARFTARATTRSQGFYVVALDRGRLLFAEPRHIANTLPGFAPPDMPYVAGLAVRSNRIETTRGLMEEAQIEPVFEDDALICVGPADALGGYLLFYGDSVARPWEALVRRA